MNKLHLYWGSGKGKTTAAMGMAVRALGHDRRVLIAQFMKSGTSGELAVLCRFANAVVYPSVPVSGFVSRMSPDEKQQVCAEQTRMASALAETILSTRPEMIILDELAIAWQRGIVEEQTAIALVAAALISGETVVTGRDAPDWLKAHADYISRVDAQRHPYETEGLKAREGVEW